MALSNTVLYALSKMHFLLKLLVLMHLLIFSQCIRHPFSTNDLSAPASPPPPLKVSMQSVIGPESDAPPKLPPPSYKPRCT